MTDLTEQFKNDELDEDKLYYFKQKMSEEIEIGHPFSLNMVRAVDDIYLDWFLIDEVLAPVPSYEEWQKLKEFADYSIHNRNELTRQINFWMQENTKLKELLKECRLAVFDYPPYDLASDKIRLEQRIDEVLK